MTILEEVTDALGLITNPTPCRHCGARVAVRMRLSGEELALAFGWTTVGVLRRTLVNAETQRRMVEALAEHEADCLCGGTVCSEKST